MRTLLAITLVTCILLSAGPALATTDDHAGTCGRSVTLAAGALRCKKSCENAIIIASSGNCHGKDGAAGQDGEAGCGNAVMVGGNANCRGGDGGDGVPARPAGDGGDGCSTAVDIGGTNNCRGGDGGDGADG